MPLSVVFLIVIAVLTWVFLELTRHGRVMYAIGSNAQAAALAGINVARYRVLAYMISGVMASIGGFFCPRDWGGGMWRRGTTCCWIPWPPR